MIEAQFAELADKLAAATDFKDAEHAHAGFLTSLVEQSFLDVLPVTQALEGIYALCIRLCSLIEVVYHMIRNPQFIA